MTLLTLLLLLSLYIQYMYSHLHGDRCGSVNACVFHPVGNYRSVPIGIGTYGAPLGNCQAGSKLEIPGSRCHNPLSTE